MSESGADGAELTLEYVQALTDDINTFWLLFGGVLVFAMQAGFAMLLR